MPALTVTLSANGDGSALGALGVVGRFDYSETKIAAGFFPSKYR